MTWLDWMNRIWFTSSLLSFLWIVVCHHFEKARHTRSNSLLEAFIEKWLGTLVFAIAISLILGPFFLAAIFVFLITELRDKLKK